MAYQNLIYEFRTPLAFVTLNRPNVLNALNQETLSELEQTFTEISQDPAIRAVLLTGSGDKAFAAGADISELAAVSGPAAEEFAVRGQHVFNLVENCGKPVIGCVNGFALGGGCELALACTFRIASENARMGQPEVKLGIIPGYGGSQRLPRLIGKGAALKLLLTGEMVSATEALRLGLVEEVVAAEQLLSRGEQLARAIAGMAPIAIRECMRAVNLGGDLPLRAALEMEAAAFGMICSTTDKAEGTRAFLEKRSPVWTGN